MATVFALEQSIPVWTALLAVFFLGERLHRGRLAAMCLGIVGVIIILKPGLSIIDPASFIVIGAAFCYSVAYITTKSMTKSESPLAILFYMNLIQFPLGLIPASFDWVALSVEDIHWILLLGMGGFFSHYCLTRAFEVAETLTVVPIDFVRVPLIAIIGYFFYNEILEITLLLGALIIFIGNYYNLRYESNLVRDD